MISELRYLWIVPHPWFFGIVAITQDLAQSVTLRLCQIAILVRLERRFGDNGWTGRRIVDDGLEQRSHRLGRDVALALDDFAAVRVEHYCRWPTVIFVAVRRDPALNPGRPEQRCTLS